jgi:hypothetical protein
MEQIDLNKTVFEKRQYQKVIDTSFTQLIPANQVTSEVTSSVTVDQFFNYYNELFFDIPKFGEANSHEYLIKTSQEYVGTTFQSDEIQALIDEVTFLRQQNLELQQQYQIINNNLPPNG